MRCTLRHHGTAVLPMPAWYDQLRRTEPDAVKKEGYVSHSVQAVVLLAVIPCRRWHLGTNRGVPSLQEHAFVDSVDPPCHRCPAWSLRGQSPHRGRKDRPQVASIFSLVVMLSIGEATTEQPKREPQASERIMGQHTDLPAVVGPMP